jgi:hypothetical protein
VDEIRLFFFNEHCQKALDEIEQAHAVLALRELVETPPVCCTVK